MKIDVIKFGGSSLKDESAREMALSRVLEHLHKADVVVVVVSAMGRFPACYATDTLASMTTHLSPKDKDRFISLGEVISSLVFLNCCKAHGLKACALSISETGIISDDRYQKGRVLAVCDCCLKQAVHQYEVVIVPGFTAVSITGNTITLGRGGSDLSAFVIASALKVPFVSIYTDVSGVYDQDPKRCPDAQRYEKIDVQQLLKLIEQGAKIMQKESVLYAIEKKMNFEVKSTFDQKNGTFIQVKPDSESDMPLQTKL